jgi:hypothetical protein
MDFCDPADMPRSSISDDPVQHLEPAEDSTPLGGMSDQDMRTAVATFESVMRFCLDGKDLVHKGLRSSIVISALRPDLGAGLKIDRQTARIFAQENAGANGSLELTGRLFGPCLEWIRRGNRVSEFGERVTILFYILRPDLLDEPATLAELGKIANKTRQAKDKLVSELRDTFGGLRGRSMRAECTRLRCKNSHLRKSRAAE